MTEAHTAPEPLTCVLGVDAALRCTGAAVVKREGSRLRAIELATIRNRPSARLSACLCRLHDELDGLIARHRPQSVAVEGSFYFKNARTAMVLGQARGVAVMTCASRGLPVFEYAPRRIKQAVVGYGNASKEQVRRMVTNLLALPREPQEDAGDALAIAICHLHSATRYAVLNSHPV